MRRLIIILGLALSAGSGGAGAQELAETLTLSRVLLPVSPDDRPSCVSLSADGRLMAFHSKMPGGHGGSDIWLSRLEDGRWSKPYNPGPGVNTKSWEVDGRLSADGASIIFIRGGKDAQDRESSQIHVSRLSNGKWSRAEPIGASASPANTIELGAVLGGDGDTLYFASNRPGGYGRYDFYYSKRIGGAWSAPINLGPDVNTAEDEIDLAVNRAGDAIIFPADRKDAIGRSHDLYISRKLDGKWGPARNLGPRINTAGNDTCPWLSHDGKTLYLNTDWNGLIEGGKGPRFVWKFHYSKGF